MYSNIQSIIMYREGENFIWFINPTNWWDMVEILDAISHKLSGQKVYSMVWNGFDLQHGWERF